jgi:hypothetical protein
MEGMSSKMYLGFVSFVHISLLKSYFTWKRGVNEFVCTFSVTLRVVSALTTLSKDDEYHGSLQREVLSLQE